MFALQEWGHVDWKEGDVFFDFKVFIVDEI